jgi:hypothetical protein
MRVKKLRVRRGSGGFEKENNFVREFGGAQW